VEAVLQGRDIDSHLEYVVIELDSFYGSRRSDFFFFFFWSPVDLGVVNCWPTTNDDGGCDVNIEYEAENENVQLHNLVITIPLP
jgi:hypothetical protein